MGDTLSLKYQAENMVHIFENNLFEDALRASLESPLTDSFKNAYYNQNLNKIEEYSILIYSDTTIVGKKQRDLLFERNFKWVEHIPSLIREQPSFIAVGVRHLPGENGLIDLLRKEGFTVKPLQ